MRKYKIIILSVLFMTLLFCVTGCSSGESTADRLSLIMDDVIKIVKVNSDKPAVAAVILNKYIKDNFLKLESFHKDFIKEVKGVKEDLSNYGDFMKKFEICVKKEKVLRKVSKVLMKNYRFAKAMNSFQVVALGEKPITWNVLDRQGLILEDVINIINKSPGDPRVAAKALNRYTKSNYSKIVSTKKACWKYFSLNKNDSNKMKVVMKGMSMLTHKFMELGKLSAKLKKYPEFAKAMAFFLDASSGQ